MELTLDEALKKGIEAHKAGQIQKAEMLYTAVLKAHPKHPDANHNMGVLSAGVGKIQEALPFFKVALGANPRIGQFWLSYIDVLIKLGRIADAKAIFLQAKDKGIKSQAFNQLEKRLSGPSTNPSAPSTDQLQSIISLYTQGKLQQALSRARQMLEEFPNSVVLYNIAGASNAGLMQFDAAISNFKQALQVKPGNAEAHNNIGNALKGKGDLEAAVENYRQAIKINPDFAEAYYNMAVALKDDDDLEAAVASYKQAIKIKPNYAEAYNNMGIILLNMESPEAAIVSYKLALKVKPDFAEAYNNLGTALNAKGDLKAAIVSYKQAIKIKPDYAEAFNNIGIALNTKGDLQAAIDCYKQALKINPDYADAYYNMGNALKEKSDLQAAIDCYKQALKINPDYADAFNNMGTALKEKGNLDTAIDCYKQALKINPNYSEACYNMGIALKEKGDLDTAIDCYKQALKINPNYSEAYNNMGIALIDKDAPEGAIDCYTQALKIKPEYADAYYNMGNALTDKGDSEAAIDCYKKALSINPDYAEAHRALSDLIRYKEHDEHFVKMQSLYMDSSITDELRCNLSFALSKASEDLNQISQSFSYLKTGNELRKSMLSYNIKQDIELFSQLKKSYLGIAKVALQSAVEISVLKPIFILGMPRSGTTLVEQIVSSHSEVAAAGELDYVRKFGHSIAKGVIKPNTEVISSFKQRYIEALTKRSDGRSLVTDKMPHNFQYIGLILSAFPNAKVIHVNRDPAATCWSNYKHYFAAKDLGYSYNLDDVVTYFGLYKDLMQFWNTYYGDRIFDLNYDNLTINQEDQTRKLIQHLGLEWERGCLSPQSNKRNVRTASQQQVPKRCIKAVHWL